MDKLTIVNLYPDCLLVIESDSDNSFERAQITHPWPCRRSSERGRQMRTRVQSAAWNDGVNHAGAIHVLREHIKIARDVELINGIIDFRTRKSVNTVAMAGLRERSKGPDTDLCGQLLNFGWMFYMDTTSSEFNVHCLSIHFESYLLDKRKIQIK